MKKYRLLKDTPVLKAGTIFTYNEGTGEYECPHPQKNNVTIHYFKETVEDNHNWFEEMDDTHKWTTGDMIDFVQYATNNRLFSQSVNGFDRDAIKRIFTSFEQQRRIELRKKQREEQEDILRRTEELTKNHHQ